MPRHSPRPAAVRAAATLGACGCLLLSACGFVDPAPDAEDYRGPAAPKLRLEKVWGGEDASLERADYALQVGRTMVLGSSRAHGDVVVAADAATGRVRWRVDGDTPRSPVVARTGLTRARPDVSYWPDTNRVGGDAKAAKVPGGGIVAVPYRQRPAGAERTRWTDGYAIAALGLADGRVRWATTVLPRLPLRDPRARPDDPAQVVAVTRAAVVVNVDAPGTGFFGAGTDKPALTVALDPRTGRKLWSRKDTLAFGATGDTVVVRSHAGLPPPKHAGEGDGYPAVLDARTGEPRWRGKHPSYAVWISDSHAVLRPTDHDLPLDVVDLRRATATTDDDVDGIVTDGGLLAELHDAQDLYTRPVTADELQRGTTAFPSLDGGRNEADLEASAGRYLWGHSWEEIDGPDRWTTFALDRTGARRASVDGLPMTVSADHLVVSGDNDDIQAGGNPFTVYRITRA